MVGITDCKRRDEEVEFQNFLIYLSTVFLAVWTARLAYRRGKNPLIWAGVTLALGFIMPSNWNLLAVVPALALTLGMLLRPSGNRIGGLRQREPVCPHCSQPYDPQQNYCTACGRELARETPPEVSDPLLASESSAPAAAATMESAAVTMEPPPSDAPASGGLTEPAEPPPQPDSGARPGSPTADRPDAAPKPAAATAADRPEPQPAATESAKPGESAPAETGAVAESDGRTDTEPADTEPAEPTRPWGIPQPSPAPTAAVMLERGLARLGEGRPQEAIDQFTKALALDANYRQALEQRAEAYAQLGRHELAAADRQRAVEAAGE